MQDRYMRFDEVSQTIGLKRTAIYKLIKEGKFPQPVKLGARASGWLASEVNSWVMQRAQQRVA